MCGGAAVRGMLDGQTATCGAGECGAGAGAALGAGGEGALVFS